MENVKDKIRSLIDIVNELENDFPGRHFTIDGHLVGSIGEVIAAYHYGVKLYTASEEIHDGEVGDRKIQIKISQQDSIKISHEPEYLIVLYLNKTGEIYEVYNGPGREPWINSSKPDSRNNKTMRVNKLMDLDRLVESEDRIKQLVSIEKMKIEFKNRKK